MDKKYQVFISSTYKDLIEERQKVIEVLLAKSCFPVGMEYFPAADDDQFTVIKKFIDSCDYFILIIGGRYGSIEPKSGKSYTQLEFEYAVKKGIPVASFYHNDISKLTGDKLEDTDECKQKLNTFKKLVQTKLCNPWKDANDLAIRVLTSLDYLFENSPRTGWVRANFISTSEANALLYKLKVENEQLKKEIEDFNIKEPDGLDNLQKEEDKFYFRLFFLSANKPFKYTPFNVTWNELFTVVGPWLIDCKNDEEIKDILISHFAPMNLDEKNEQFEKVEIPDDDFQTIKFNL